MVWVWLAELTEEELEDDLRDIRDEVCAELHLKGGTSVF